MATFRSSALVSALFVSLTRSIVIDTKSGKIEGVADELEHGGHIFYNIPYAEPPVGELRFKPTKPLQDPTWEGTFNGTAPGCACHQGVSAAHMMMEGSNDQMSEDCLTLAIQTPFDFDNADSQSLRPVLFWIHGGGLSTGTGYSYVGVGGNLVANQDIVVVSINYRLNLAGWLVDPDLRGSDQGNGGANGFLDMITALKWVRDNIEAYGGDANEITIAGESGGGWATCGLLLSPLARGLFKRSIQMSGSCIESMGMFFSESEAWELAKNFRDSINASSFDELRTMDMQTMAVALESSMKTILPAIDGYVFPKSTLELVRSGVVNGESTMIGTVFRESFSGPPFNFGPKLSSVDDLNNWYLDKLYDSEARLLQSYYPVDEVYTKIWPYGESAFADNVSSLVQTVQSTDCWVKCGSLWQADALAENPLLKRAFPTFFYQLGYVEQPWDAVSHGYDLLPLFGHDVEWVNCGKEFSDEFMRITQDYFGGYIKGRLPVTSDGTVASLQNGVYAQIVDEVKFVDTSDLDVVRDRCEVYRLLGESFFRNPMCIGIFVEDWDFSDFMPAEDAADGEAGAGQAEEEASGKQEI